MPSTIATPPLTDDRDLLLRMVEEGHRKNTWNGTNLHASLADVTAAEATWRPAGAKNSIAAIALHCAFWKNAIRESMVGQRQRSFPLPGKNWFEIASQLNEAQWTTYRDLLETEHRELVKAIRDSRRQLSYHNPRSRSLTRMLFGIAMHDAYHTGQIHLLRAMYGNRTKA